MTAPVSADRPPVAPDAPAYRPTTRPKWTTAGLTLAFALLVVVGAGFIGARQGFAGIGTGGQNMKLLPAIGDPAPDIVVPTVDGRLVRLSDLKGRPVWLNFWGSWCPPCRAEFPDLQAAYAERLQPAGVVLLAISLDEPPEAAANFAARNHGTFPILTDQYRTFTGAAYPIANFPTHILIDKDGIVRDIILAPIGKQDIIAAADRLLAAPGKAS